VHLVNEDLSDKYMTGEDSDEKRSSMSKDDDGSNSSSDSRSASKSDSYIDSESDSGPFRSEN